MTEVFTLIKFHDLLKFQKMEWLNKNEIHQDTKIVFNWQMSEKGAEITYIVLYMNISTFSHLANSLRRAVLRCAVTDAWKCSL